MPLSVGPAASWTQALRRRQGSKSLNWNGDATADAVKTKHQTREPTEICTQGKTAHRGMGTTAYTSVHTTTGLQRFVDIIDDIDYKN